MGVYWAKTAEQDFKGHLNIIDLRTLFPLDEELIYETVKSSGKCLVVTEEPESNSFAQSLAAKISYSCFRFLDAPVTVIGAENLPAIPLNAVLESTMLPNAEKVKIAIKKLLEF
jgi:2-oxoisovalerate dehydrogenase E1 component